MKKEKKQPGQTGQRSKKKQTGQTEQTVQRPRQLMPLQSIPVLDDVRDHSTIIQHALDKIKSHEKLKNLRKTSVAITPTFAVWGTLFGNLPEVANPIEEKAKSVSGLNWFIKDKYGKRHDYLYEKVNQRFGLENLIRRASLQYDVYGTVLYVEFQGREKFFRTLPASEAISFFANSDTFEINAFTWEDNEIYSYRMINVYEPSGKRNAYIGTMADADSLLFGYPPLRSLFTILDMKFRDDENYQLFLKNGSFPGLLALMSSDEISLAQEMDSFFRSLRDDKQRHKASVIMGAYENGQPKVDLHTVKQQIGERLTNDEKKEIYGKTLDALGIPRALFGVTSSKGIGASEFEPLMIKYRESSIHPHAKKIRNDLMVFFLPEMLKEFESEINEIVFEVEEDGRVKKENATLEDFYLEFDPMKVEMPKTMREAYLQAYEKSAITRAELKVKAFGYKDDELNEDDDVYYKSNSAGFIKRGETVTERGEEVADEKNETAIEQETKDDIREKSLISFIRNYSIKDLNFKKRGEYKDIEKQKAFLDGFSDVEKALDTKQAKEFKKWIKEKLEKQYAINPSELITSTPNLSSGTLKRAFQDQLIQQVRAEVDKNSIDEKELIEAMLFFGNLGVRIADKSALNEDLPVLSSDKKQNIDERIKEYISSRIGYLFGIIGLQQLSTDPVLRPQLDQTLNQTTAEEVTEIITNHIEEKGIDGINKAYEEKAKERIEDRSVLITNVELGKMFSVGLYLAGDKLGAVNKEWLRTVSAKPRAEHLAQVGAIVPYTATFPTGEFWSQERINCKCGIRLIYK